MNPKKDGIKNHEKNMNEKNMNEKLIQDENKKVIFISAEDSPFGIAGLQAEFFHPLNELLWIYGFMEKIINK